MGIQLHAELKDLPESFKQEIKKKSTVNTDCYHYGCSICGGSGCLNSEDVLIVHFPKNGPVQSYDTDSLVFDNKFANEHLREELDEHNIPYTRG